MAITPTNNYVKGDGTADPVPQSQTQAAFVDDVLANRDKVFQAINDLQTATEGVTTQAELDSAIAAAALEIKGAVGEDHDSLAELSAAIATMKGDVPATHDTLEKLYAAIVEDTSVPLDYIEFVTVTATGSGTTYKSKISGMKFYDASGAIYPLGAWRVSESGAQITDVLSLAYNERKSLKCEYVLSSPAATGLSKIAASFVSARFVDWSVSYKNDKASITDTTFVMDPPIGFSSYTGDNPPAGPDDLLIDSWDVSSASEYSTPGKLSFEQLHAWHSRKTDFLPAAAYPLEVGSHRTVTEQTAFRVLTSVQADAMIGATTMVINIATENVEILVPVVDGVPIRFQLPDGSREQSITVEPGELVGYLLTKVGSEFIMRDVGQIDNDPEPVVAANTETPQSIQQLQADVQALQSASVPAPAPAPAPVDTSDYRSRLEIIVGEPFSPSKPIAIVPDSPINLGIDLSEADALHLAMTDDVTESPGWGIQTVDVKGKGNGYEFYIWNHDSTYLKFRIDDLSAGTLIPTTESGRQAKITRAWATKVDWTKLLIPAGHVIEEYDVTVNDAPAGSGLEGVTFDVPVIVPAGEEIKSVSASNADASVTIRSKNTVSVFKPHGSQTDTVAITVTTGATEIGADIITKVYDATMPSVASNNGFWTAPDSAEMAAAGYFVLEVSVLLNFSGNFYINPGNYIGSDHSTLGTRLSWTTDGVLSAYQVGNQAFGKPAKFILRWFKV